MFAMRQIDTDNSPAVTRGDLLFCVSRNCNTTFTYRVARDAEPGWRSMTVERAAPSMPSGWELATISTRWNAGDQWFLLPAHIIELPENQMEKAA